jgi:hypothetical protein
MQKGIFAIRKNTAPLIKAVAQTLQNQSRCWEWIYSIFRTRSKKAAINQSSVLCWLHIAPRKWHERGCDG